MFQRIMLAWDGSDVARAALDVAIDVARRYQGELVAVVRRLLTRPRRDRG
jgi:nucleotide-binding universal stress UspA family protein